MKYLKRVKKVNGMDVAPLVGAWIEISKAMTSSEFANVAPLVGAWIEITIDLTATDNSGNVAPLVGAWIEIKNQIIFGCNYFESLLSWERGLKSIDGSRILPFVKSLLSWERGLKSHA